MATTSNDFSTLKTSYKEEVGNQIRQFRESRKIKQPELADLVDVSQSSVSNWEKGKPTLDALIRLSAHFEVPVGTFLPDSASGVSDGVALTLQRLYQEMEKIAIDYEVADHLPDVSESLEVDEIPSSPEGNLVTEPAEDAGTGDHRG